MIDSVLVYNKEWIEIVWKMDDRFFKKMVGKNCL